MKPALRADFDWDSELDWVESGVENMAVGEKRSLRENSQSFLRDSFGNECSALLPVTLRAMKARALM